MKASSLFVRLFSATAAVVAALFAAMYLLAVPFMQQTAERLEQESAKNLLNEVFASVEETSRNLQNYRESLIAARKQELRDIVAVVASRSDWLEGQVKAGRLGKAQAKAMLLGELRHIKFGKEDYVWASDYGSVLVSHPDPKLNGADFSDKRDVRGNLIVPPMVAGARAHGDGFHSYWWRRLGDVRHIEKLTYYRHLPFFALVVGTGVYVDDIESAFQAGRAAAIEALRQRLRQTRLARTGYLYVFEGRSLTMLAHPNPNLENKNFADAVDPSSGRPLSQLLMEAADKPEGLRYKWDRPDDPGRYIYDKISWVRHAADFDWYVGSSIYVDELDESAQVLRNRTLAVFGVAMLAALAMAYMLVKRLVAPLQDSVEHLDARVRARTAELEQANARLQQLDRLKSEFLSSVSHELRTPLTSIRGFAALVEREFKRSFAGLAEADAALAKPCSRIQDNVGIILKESDRLTRLINDVLDLAKIEAGRVEWRADRLDAGALIEDSVAAARGAFEPKAAVELRVEVAPGLPPVVGDADRLQQVLVNLLNNAAKFTEQGSVAVTARLDEEGRVLIEVADTGIGFPPEDAEAIFDKFQQARQGDTLLDRPKGTGLGLAICREIVAHHGGRIWARSRPGQGSVFSLTLPAAEP
ncbi:MAG TPA: cache domain-containing protein [Rhodocyclaceae bacterium]